MADPTWTSLIVDVPDYPKQGVVFFDITPVLGSSTAFREIVDAICDEWRDAGITKVVGIESRGFIFAAAVAYALDVGLVIIRKPNKLPRETASVSYDLEYGTDTIEIHVDSAGPDDRLVLIDDVLATGGTAEAACKLVEQTGARLDGFVFPIELDFLDGRTRLPAGLKIQSLHHIV